MEVENNPAPKLDDKLDAVDELATVIGEDSKTDEIKNGLIADAVKDVEHRAEFAENVAFDATQIAFDAKDAVEGLETRFNERVSSVETSIRGELEKWQQDQNQRAAEMAGMMQEMSLQIQTLLSSISQKPLETPPKQETPKHHTEESQTEHQESAVVDKAQVPAAKARKAKVWA